MSFTCVQAYRLPSLGEQTSPGEISAAHGISVVFSCFMIGSVHPSVLQTGYNGEQRKRQTRGNAE